MNEWMDDQSTIMLQVTELKTKPHPTEDQHKAEHHWII